MLKWVFWFDRDFDSFILMLQTKHVVQKHKNRHFLLCIMPLSLQGLPSTALGREGRSCIAPLTWMSNIVCSRAPSLSTICSCCQQSMGLTLFTHTLSLQKHHVQQSQRSEQILTGGLPHVQHVIQRLKTCQISLFPEAGQPMVSSYLAVRSQHLISCPAKHLVFPLSCFLCIYIYIILLCFNNEDRRSVLFLKCCYLWGWNAQ